MYIVPIAWIYVAFMMAVAEATNSNGTVLGALITFILYGLLPVGLILYFMGGPARRRALRERENQNSVEPNTSSHSPADSVAPMRKEDWWVAKSTPRLTTIIAKNGSDTLILKPLTRQTT